VIEAQDPAARLPDLRQLAAQDRRAADRERAGRIVLGELAAEPGAAPAGEPARRRFSLPHDRRDAPARERPGGRATRHATPDDRDIAGLGDLHRWLVAHAAR